ncbi:MAG TPA: nuclear transport factor 2 family protein [Candidatus Saccharimonadia bacterium]|nr:nuclear transport factor 2 family protein [Candidatus Saccharimonadia bacterium]
MNRRRIATLLTLAIVAGPIAAFGAETVAPTAAPPPAALEIPTGEALKAQIIARDAALFDTLFNRCEPEAMRAMLAPDLEFYHDKDGLIRGADALVAGYEKNCNERKAPDAWRSRRELVESSVIVSVVPGVGAIESGEHLFYERKGDGDEMLVGRARFAQLWILAPDGWRLSRVFSYDHAPAGENG